MKSIPKTREYKEFDIKEAYKILLKAYEEIQSNNEKREKAVLIKKINDLVKDKEIIMGNSMRTI